MPDCLFVYAEALEDEHLSDDYQSEGLFFVPGISKCPC